MMRFLDLWWWLRSTTGSYGRPELEVAYGKIVISLHRGCLRDVSSGRVVGVSTWCITHGRHTRVNTSVGTVYVFFIFNTKSIRIMFSKIYIYYERTLVVSDVILARWRSGNVFDRPWRFFLEMENPQIYRYCFFKTEIDLHICFIYNLLWFHVKLIVISIHHWAYGLLTLLFLFYRLVVILLYRTAVVKITLPRRSLIR